MPGAIYLLTVIGPARRVAFAPTLPSQSTRQSRTTLEAVLAALPQTPRILLSENGSGFEAGLVQRQ